MADHDSEDEKVDSTGAEFSGASVAKDLEQSVAPEQEAAKEDGLSPDKWFEITPGMEVEFQGAKYDLGADKPKEDQRMTYDYNNGTVAYVDAAGHLRVAPSTRDRFGALAAAGYSQGSLGVPLSNQERFADPDLQSRWDSMRDQAREQNRQEETAEHLRRYHEEAEKKGIKPVGGDWMSMDGVEVLSPQSSEPYTEEPNTNGYAMPQRRLEQVGTYDYNNNTIAFVDGEGHLQVAPATRGRFNALATAGYSHGSLGVPLSNGEMPTDPQQKERWEQLYQQSVEQRRKDTTEDHLRRYHEEAEKKGVKPVEGDWLEADGIEVESLQSSENYDVEPNTDGYSMPQRRLEQVGTYDHNNGVLACVDGEGHLRLAPSTKDRFDALAAAGYRQGSIGIPLSNGELPADAQVRTRWESMEDQAKQERAA